MMYVVVTLLVLILSAIIAPKATRLIVVWSLAGAAAATVILGAIWLGLVLYDVTLHAFAYVTSVAHTCNDDGWSVCSVLLIDAYRDPANSDAVWWISYGGFWVAMLVLMNVVGRLLDKYREWQWERGSEARKDGMFERAIPSILADLERRLEHSSADASGTKKEDRP